jgi:hypothetical protein
LVRSLTSDQAIASFNWDVLLEVAFRRLGRVYTYLPTKCSEDAVLLLRPHGCISWFGLLDRELLKINLTANVGILGDDLNYYMLYPKDPLGPRDMGRSNRFAKHALSPLAAIVPPSAAKVLSVGGPTHDEWVDSGHSRAMRAVWDVFRASVATADEIVVIGYSLPGPDASAIEVLREFGARTRARNSPKRLLIVDPDPGVVERYRRIVFPRAELISDDFSQFNPDNL